MSVIEASSAGVKDMADGSLRITFEFDPRHAAEAFALFGPRGRAVAVAALKDGSGAITSEKNKPAEDKTKGGEWAKLAGMWCNDPDFWDWCQVTSESAAVEMVRNYAGIKSRAELDNDPDALERFNKNIRRPFVRWMQDRGISK